MQQSRQRGLSPRYQVEESRAETYIVHSSHLLWSPVLGVVLLSVRKFRGCFLLVLIKYQGPVMLQGRALAWDRAQACSTGAIPIFPSTSAEIAGESKHCKNLFELKHRSCLSGFLTLFLLPNNELFLFFTSMLLEWEAS